MGSVLRDGNKCHNSLSDAGSSHPFMSALIRILSERRTSILHLSGESVIENWRMHSIGRQVAQLSIKGVSVDKSVLTASAFGHMHLSDRPSRQLRLFQSDMFLLNTIFEYLQH